MTINPNDPVSKMTIRLHLAAMIAQGLVSNASSAYANSLADPIVIHDSFAYADAMIERANREE